MWLEDLDRSSNDVEVQVWVKQFVKFADKVITPKKKGEKVGFTSGRRHFKIVRDK